MCVVYPDTIVAEKAQRRDVNVNVNVNVDVSQILYMSS